MTTTHTPENRSAPRTSEPPDHNDLREHLSEGYFPGTRDHFLAALARRHAPTALLWELGRLAPHRRYDSVDQVCADLEARTCPDFVTEPI
ncbi:DUF2795 domain-containing protein [Phycicoccus sp. Root101]|uniref:DUF2795 domain-containing protein n=1 Tax=Phycicoccus sp. Root101 TaxID=1736421 RepID=UPI00138F5845